MIPKIGISEINLKRCTDMLSVVLADEMTLYIKLRKFHWNVTGDSFMELHKLYEDHYSQLELMIDEVAERISKLGSKAIGTMAEFSERTRIKEEPNAYPSQKQMNVQLVEDHQTIIAELRKDIDLCADEIHDAGTADLLTKMLQQHETMAWVVRRYLS